MSREIKFRIWDDFKKEWLGKSDKDSLTFYGFCLVGEVMTVQCPSQWALDECCVVEQYTGLIDKNGKEIYEGDIVSCYSLSGEYGALFVVKYGKLPDICGHEYCPCLQGFYLDEIDEYEEVDEEGYIEVIGNIHEKSELLEDENGKN